MNKQEAEKCAKEITYRDAVNNALRGKCIPYRKATLIKLYELLDIIKSLQSEPCEDAVSRKEVLRLVNGGGGSSEYYGIFERLTKEVKALPSVTPREPKKGHWIDKEEKTAVCSCCNRNNLLYGDFCKWCGAKMTESEEQYG